MKRKAPSIDMTSNGHIKDICPNGYKDCSENLSNVLYQLHIRRPLPKKSRHIKVLVSDIFREQRVEKVKVYTFGYLCREYVFIKEKLFTIEDHKKDTD